MKDEALHISLERLRQAGLHPVAGGTEAPAANGADTDGDAGGEPEFVTDPESGKKVSVSDLFAMRGEATRRFQQASEIEQRANAALDRVIGTIGQNGGDGSGDSEPAPDAKQPFDLEDVDLVGEEGMAELGRKLNLGANATADQIRQEMDRRNEALKKELTDAADERDLASNAHRENLDALHDYMEQAGIPKERRKQMEGEFIAHLRGLPKNDRYATAGNDGYRRFTDAAFKAADYAIRGDDVVAAAAAKAAEEAREKFLRDSDTAWDSGGGGSVTAESFREMDLEGKAEFLESFPTTDDKLDWIEANLTTDETMDLLQQGASRQIAESTGGRPRAQLV